MAIGSCFWRLSTPISHCFVEHSQLLPDNYIPSSNLLFYGYGVIIVQSRRWPELYQVHTPCAASASCITAAACVSLLMTNLYQLLVHTSRKHIATVDRRGYGGQQNGTFVTFVAVSIDLKHTEANFSPSSIDSLCLQVAQVPRPPDLAILCGRRLTTTTMMTDMTNYLTCCCTCTYGIIMRELSASTEPGTWKSIEYLMHVSSEYLTSCIRITFSKKYHWLNLTCFLDVCNPMEWS